MRVDIWDVKKQEEAPSLDCGYPRDFADHFTVDRVIGKGGFGLVKVVIEKSTGQEYACKSIKKKLDIPNISAEKLAQHLDNVDREAKILKRLRGTLSVVHFKGAWEDDQDVHLVMEYCRGGELHHRIGLRIYTEEAVADYMRSVLHTLAQCHSHRILHRDIKPGNFMLLTDADNSPLKAIDFGMAVFFNPDNLPRTDLGLDGTPWFMAPEVLNSQTYPASDLWSAGVMAYQLLSGYLPFDDQRNPESPALSVIWRGILSDEPSFRRSAWAEVSEEAKTFIKSLLNKDHEKRLTAKEALKHPWLQTSFHKDKKRPLSATVVQRIQRFAQTNLLRRTILELMAHELLKMAPPRLSDPSIQGGGAAAMALQHQPTALGTSPGSSDARSSQGDGSAHGGAVFPMSPDTRPSLLAGGPPGGGGGIPISGDRIGRRSSLELPSAISGRPFPRSPSAQQIATLARAAFRRGAATVHGPGDYWRIMRQASEAAAIASGHGQMNYLRAVPRSEEERNEQRKAARLSLDTSAHGSGRYAEFMAKIEEGSVHLRRKNTAPGGMRASVSTGSLNRVGGVGMSMSAPASGSGSLVAAVEDMETERQGSGSLIFPTTLEGHGDEGVTTMDEDTMERGGRGRSLAFAALQAGGSGDSHVLTAGGQDASQPSPFESARMTAAAAPPPPPSHPNLPDDVGNGRTAKKVTFKSPNVSGDHQYAANIAVSNVNAGSREEQQEPTSSTSSPFDMPRSASQHTGPVVNTKDLENLMRRMQFKSGQGLNKEALADGLRSLGYELDPSEVAVLMDQLDMDADEQVAPEGFVASQMDWGAMQRSNRELWLECAQRAFTDLDSNSDGKITTRDILNSLAAKLPAEELDFAVEDALLEAGEVNPEDIDFEGFLRMLHVGSFESLDSLDQYDDRFRRPLDLQDSSLHGGAGLPSLRLETVPEDPKDQQ